MSSEANSINLKNTSFQFFDLAVMTVAEKIALKKKLKFELSRVKSSSEKVGSESRSSPHRKLSYVVENNPAISRNENGAEIIEACSFMNSEKLMTSSSDNQQASFVCKRKDDMENDEDSADLSAVKKPKLRQVSDNTIVKHRSKSEFQKVQGMDAGRTKQCAVVLHKLMSHKYGWVFNRPVDPVALKIPDYFSIITKPMDLGTINYKLKNKEYSDVNEFADDVKLTFSNAMQYNPPNNDVHLMAKKLCNVFNSGWKILEAKWDKEALLKLHTKTERQNVNYAHPEVQCPEKGFADGSRECANAAVESAPEEFLDMADDGGTSISTDQYKQPEFCPSTPPVTSSKGVERLLYNEQLSPSKALRAAILKSRFADTILKAQHKTLLNCGEKRDREKLQKEIERLEQQQREEKERIEAQIRASEAAIRKKLESEQRLQREKERAAARLAIQKMEKTVDIDENWGLPRDFQSLGAVEHSEKPDEVVTNFIDGIDLLPAGSRNPLEQLGLFMKNDEVDEEDEWFCSPVSKDVEEGEIGN